MVAIKLIEAMQRYKRRTGEKMTYKILADMTDIARPTLHSIGSRRRYNATLATIEKICRALDVPLHDMLEMKDDPPKSKPKRKSKAKKKKS